MNTKSSTWVKLELAIFATVAALLCACSADGVTGELKDDLEGLDSRTSSSYDDEDDDFYGSSKKSSNSTAKRSSSSQKSSSSVASSSSNKSEAKESSYIEDFDPNLAHDSVYDSKTSRYYKTVQIGSYMWITENVNISASNSRCYNGKSKNCDIYGQLYYGTLTNLCPANFTIATTDAWEDLLKNEHSAADLKAKGLWEESKSVPASKNTTGLSLLPGGICYGNDCFEMYESAYFYGAGSPAMIYIVNFDSDKITSKELASFKNSDSLSVSVRCVQRATKLSKISDLPSDCNANDTARVVENKSKYICLSDKEWYIWPETLPTSCTAKEEGQRYYRPSYTYICHSGKVKTITELDKKLGLCNEGDKVTVDSTVYVCNEAEWKLGTLVDTYGRCLTEKPSKIVKYQYSSYVCEDSVWRYASSEEISNGICSEENNGATAKYGNQTRICDNGAWRNASFDETYGECNEEALWKEVEYNNIKYVCRGEKWESLNQYEKTMGVCNPKNEKKLAKYNSYYYICKGNQWQDPTVDDIPVKCTSSIADSVFTTSKKKFVCDATTQAWREFTEIEYSIGICSAKIDKKTEKNVRTIEYYICKNHAWEKTNELTYLLGDCSSENEKEIKEYNKKEYICKSNSWSIAKLDDILGICTASNYRDTVRYKDTLLICYNGWESVSFEKFYGKCESSRDGETQYNFINKFWEVCKWNRWTMASMEDLFPCDASHEADVETMPYTDEKYVCKIFNSNGLINYYWSNLDKRDLAIGPCTPKNIDEVALYEGSYLVCKDISYSNGPLYAWTNASKLEVLGECNSSNEGKKVQYATQNNICKNGKWTVEYGSVDGYKTVELAGKTWMAANIDGSKTGAHCYEGNGNNSGCSNGGFYTYADAQNACPTGWQLPDTSDFAEVIRTTGQYGGSNENLYADLYDMSQGSWQSADYRSGLDAFGFSLKGLGYCSASRICSETMRETYLWTRTQGKSGVYAYHFTYNYTITVEEMPPESYLGVRCIKK